ASGAGVHRRVDEHVLARFGMAIVENHHRRAQMTLWFDSFESFRSAGFQIHARVRPPETAAPHRRTPIRLLVPDYQVFRRCHDGAALEPRSRRETDASHREISSAV